MPLCITINGSGALIPSPVSDITNCTGYALVTAGEYAQLNAANSAIITDSASAETVAFGVVALLAVGFTYRTLIRLLTTSEGETNEQH